LSTTQDKPQRADARRNRERVLLAARAAFAEFGVELPMDDLARRAGVGVGTLYRHFPNKDALLDALIVDHFGQIAAAARVAVTRDDAWDAFCELIWMGAERQAEDCAFCDTLAARKAISTSPDVAAVRAEVDRFIGQLIERAQAAGDMRSDFTIDDVPLLFASIAGATRSADGQPGLDWRRQVRFLLDGLRAPA
jgi:AcrR family transcriptional regulator